MYKHGQRRRGSAPSGDGSSADANASREERFCAATARNLRPYARPRRSYVHCAERAQGVRCMVDLSRTMISWIDEVPLQEQSSQRFGNLAFRTYIQLVEQVRPLAHQIVSRNDAHLARSACRPCCGHTTHHHISPSNYYRSSSTRAHSATRSG